MLRKCRFRNVRLAAAILLLCGAPIRAEEPSPAQQSAANFDEKELSRSEALFRGKVRLLLKTKCLACHGDDPNDLKGGYDLRKRDAALKGGDSGEPAVVPGKPEHSPLYVAVTRKDDALVMPPKENDKLTADEVELIRQWILLGAAWSEKPERADWNDADGVPVVTSGGRSDDWTNRRYKPEDLWAWQPLRKPQVPKRHGAQTEHINPVDAFIAAKLSERSIERTAEPADRRTLIRRATFDLTGLPPTPEEVEAFVNDNSPQAYERLIDRLLAGDHYGEQMARHWLDVVRYADTSGFSNDYERPNAWRYRDYVVRSFNGDKPFDRFVVEQIAGDELDENDPEQLIAAGFLRMGPWEHTGMTVAAVTRQQYLDDITHSIGVSFLGQGLRCAACHDHKFDPVPTKDYYRIQAVFATTYFTEREAPFLPEENISGFDAGREASRRRLQAAKETLAAVKEKNETALAEYLKERGVKKFADLPKEDRKRRDTFGLTKTELTIRKVNDKRVQFFERELRRYEPLAFSVYSGASNDYFSPKLVNPIPKQQPDVLPVVYILPGGSLESPADAVSPGMLSAMSGFATQDAKAAATEGFPDTVSGRRLALARWIASPDNTLTARVIVNRVWQWHFGTGLVRTPNNFGKMGAKPSHPELLDWLATWFIDNGWSLKKLHRLIVTSATYRQSGLHPEMEKLREIDSRNELLAYFPSRRLAAEEIRDGLLAVTGDQLGGRAAAAAHHGFGGAGLSAFADAGRTQPAHAVRIPHPDVGRPDAGSVQPAGERSFVRPAGRNDGDAAGVCAVQRGVHARPLDRAGGETDEAIRYDGTAGA
jgi:mono/diheme cytochrome c family protein